MPQPLCHSLDLTVVLSPHSTGFEPRDTCISPAEYLRVHCKLIALKPFVPESQQAGSHSSQAESSLGEPMVVSVIPVRAGQGSSAELCL